MIYGFIIDEALHKWDDNTLLASAVDQGAGYATENVLEYFNKVGVIRDNRTSRYPYMGSGVTMYGKLGFIVDQMPPDTDGVVDADESSDATPRQVLNYDTLTETEWSRIFNIIEDTLYYRSGIGNNTLANFLNLRFSSGASYNGYVVGSIAISSETSGSDLEDRFIPGITATNSNKDNVAATDLSIPMWLSFKYQTSSQGVLDFKLWIHRESFLEEYPYSTICDVVLPASVAVLANPDLLRSSIETVIDTNNFVQSVYEDNLANKEASGAAIYSTTYMPASLNLQMPFGVIYKGTEPSDDIKKKAIRAKLIKEGELVDPVITENTWYNIFPNLFVAAKFYLLPMFSNLFSKMGATNLENGITKYLNIRTVISKMFPGEDVDTLQSHMEILVHDSTNLLILVLPDAANDSNKWLHDLLHDSNNICDYIPVDGVNRIDPAFSYQTETTQNFNILMAYAIEGARSDVLPSGFTASRLDFGEGDNHLYRDFYMFEWNHTQLFVMPLAQFNSMMEE